MSDVAWYQCGTSCISADGCVTLCFHIHLHLCLWPEPLQKCIYTLLAKDCGCILTLLFHHRDRFLSGCFVHIRPRHHQSHDGHALSKHARSFSEHLRLKDRPHSHVATFFGSTVWLELSSGTAVSPSYAGVRKDGQQSLRRVNT